MQRSGVLLIALLVITPLAAEPVVHLDQNWSAHDRDWFYHINQGSRLIDYQVFLNLEATTGALFRDPQHLAGFGFIAATASQYNPDRLPVGFSRDRGYLGITCAACHTGEITYNKRRIRIDGGQSQIDLQAFLLRLEQALKATLDDAAKLTRFAQRAGLSVDTARQRMLQAFEHRAGENHHNMTSLRYGPSRLDAFGAILNKGLRLTGVDNNMNAPDAPTSYPYIWDTPHHDWVEWNGSSPNPVEGALAHNVGEVIGVYGHVSTERDHLPGGVDQGYRSSVRMRALRRVEKHVATLTSPVWPERYLSAIDRDLAARGEPLYQNYCGECHQPINRRDPARHIKVRMSSIAAAGTDPKMAQNALKHTGASGRFEGEKRFYFAGDVIEAQAPALFIVNHIMGGVMLNHPLQVWLARRDARLLGHGEDRHPRKFLDGELMPVGEETSMTALAAYKARPLNGVWATAPYLHNGSVLNLYELMLPAEQRTPVFALGDWQFDVSRVGYRGERCANGFVLDTKVSGNSNAGHEYGTGKDGKAALSDAERYAIIEYIKTL